MLRVDGRSVFVRFCDEAVPFAGEVINSRLPFVDELARLALGNCAANQPRKQAGEGAGAQ